MGRPKDGSNKTWSKEEKLRIVNRYISEGIGGNKIAKEEHISRGMLWDWIHKFQKGGAPALENKPKRGNPYAALYTSNSLAELERLRLTVLKQEIEIERLKKGYLVKGDGAEKEYVTTKDANMK